MSTAQTSERSGLGAHNVSETSFYGLKLFTLWPVIVERVKCHLNYVA